MEQANKETRITVVTVDMHPWASIRRFAVFTVRYFDCNPLRLHNEECHCPLRVALTHVKNRTRFRAVAKPYAIINVNPQSIRWKLPGSPARWPIGTVLDGDWDEARRIPIDTHWKIPSFSQRFIQGLPWEDTALFQRVYEPEFLRKGRVRGADDLGQLARRYERVYDTLYESIRQHGFLTPTLEQPDISFMYVHIGRAGELLFTRGGNHRLGIALALGLRSVPVRVGVRHLQWQRTREAIKCDPQLGRTLHVHPDLLDLKHRKP